MRALLPASGDDLFQAKGHLVKPYDFRRPTKFKKDLLRTLVMINENFARFLQTYFLGSLRIRAQVHVRGTTQYSYAEYTQLLPNPSVVALIRLEPLPGVCLLEISQNIAFAIVDKVFGGVGADVQPQRALSEIEMGVVHRVVTDMMVPLQEAWRNATEIAPVVQGMETNPLFLQTQASSEVLAVITMAVEIGEHLGHLALALPHTTVDPVLSRLASRSWQSPDPKTAVGDPEQLQRSVTEAPVSVEAFLGSAKITVAEFTGLEVGHVIALDTRVDGDISVFVGNRLTFQGRPGVVGRRLGVQIQTRPTLVDS